MSTTQKIALVTGAATGIGKATAKQLARAGYHVAINGLDAKKLSQVAEAIGTDHTLVVAGDVSQPKAVEQIIQQVIDRYGRLDVLVNNAGIFVPGHLEELSLDDWNKQLSTNVTGVFLMSKQALPHLKASKGCIVNLSSVSGLGGDWGALAYNTSKGAVSLFTKSLALDLAQEGVRVNAVAPSLIDTPLAEGIMADQEKVAKFRERIAMGRPGEPEEVADVIVFLASEAARFVTGVIVPIDGGLGASNGQPPLD